MKMSVCQVLSGAVLHGKEALVRDGDHCCFWARRKEVIGTFHLCMSSIILPVLSYRNSGTGAWRLPLS